MEWLERSLDLYSGLERQGALTGEEAYAPAELARQVVEFRKSGRSNRAG
jgi:hypothetical protein